ncbi:MAG: 5-formyltetrahydrofolate cyclo-ligase, partial [Eubacterium sp.]
MDKKAFRQETLKKRSDIYSAEIDAAIIDNFINSDVYKKADWIMLYISFGTEINTHHLVKHALADGKHIVAPICNISDHTVTLSEILNFPEDLEEGHYGILEVKDDCLRIIDPKKI